MNKYTIDDEVEVPVHPIFRNIIDKIIWGKDSKKEELINEAKRLTINND